MIVPEPELVKPDPLSFQADAPEPASVIVLPPKLIARVAVEPPDE